LSPGVGSIVVATERFQVPEYEKTAYDVYPRRAVRKPFDFTIYKLVQTGLTPPPQSLDIGGTDDLHLVDFYPKERLGGGNLTFDGARTRRTAHERAAGQPRSGAQVERRTSARRARWRG
jgi:hypothetical protein